jgi:hypothetical protein
MGMDVYGVKPKNEKGEYFRNNVWWWRPLWNYCLEMHPAIAGKVEHGHYNSGDGLNSVDSKKLALFLKKDLDSGKVEQYAKEREVYLDSLPLENCEYCQGTGIRGDKVGIENSMPDKELSPEIQALTGRTHGYCNGCSGKGKIKNWQCQYPFDVENVKQFQEFLDNCGGFSIC